MSDVFDDIGGEQLPGNHRYLEKFGKYRVEIQSARYKKGFKGKSLITEAKVITAEATAEGKQLGVEPHEPGFVGSYVEKLLDDPKKSGGGRFKAHLMEITGETKAPMAPERMRQVMNDDPKAGPVQPLTGILVDLEIYPIKLAAKEGKPEKTIAKLKWSTVPVEGQSIDGIQAARKARGLLPLG